MPDDPTPHGGEALHAPPERARIPRDPPGTAPEPAVAGTAMARRPALPTHTETMAADIEDEDADPVVEDGPGVDDPDAGRPPSVTRQPA